MARRLVYSSRLQKALVFCATALNAFTSFMLVRVAILPLFLALNLSMCKKQENASTNSKQASGSSQTPAAASSPIAAASPTITKLVFAQTAQVIISGDYRLVDSVRYPGTAIT